MKFILIFLNKISLKKDADLSNNLTEPINMEENLIKKEEIKVDDFFVSNAPAENLIGKRNN